MSSYLVLSRRIKNADAKINVDPNGDRMLGVMDL
jgi:hypothetical protein